MVTGLLSALIWIAVIALIVWGINAVIPAPPQVKTVIYVIAGVICIIILGRAIGVSMP